MSGGASGLAAKLNTPKTVSCAEREGLRLEARREFSVKVHWGRSLSHSCIRKLGSTVQSPVIRWFLYVLIARSAAFLLCICGGTRWKLTLCLMHASLISSEHSLSRMWSDGASPCDFRVLKMSSHASLMLVPRRLLIARAWIELVSKWYIMYMYLAPRDDVTGNCPVWSE